MWSASRATNTVLATIGGTSGVVADRGNGTRLTTLDCFKSSDTSHPPSNRRSRQSESLAIVAPEEVVSRRVVGDAHGLAVVLQPRARSERGDAEQHDLGEIGGVAER